MNKKGDFRIPSNRELIFIVIGFLVLVAIGIPLYNYINQNLFQQNQAQIINELKGNINTLTGSIDGIKTSVLLLNQNVGELEKTKANEATVKEVSVQVQKLNANLEKTNSNLETVNTRLTSVENNIKVIEPNYTQNIDLKDMRTYVNIFNFRLVLNFFIALSISLFAFEFVKFFGDFFSFGYLTKSYDLKAFISYRKSKKHNEIKVYQQHIHKKDETNGKTETKTN